MSQVIGILEYIADFAVGIGFPLKLQRTSEFAGRPFSDAAACGVLKA